jgi:alpha-glucosidase
LYNKSHRDLPLFIEQIRALTDGYADRFTVAEVGGAVDIAEMQRYTAGSNRFHSAYDFKFLDAEQLTPALIQTTLEAWPDAAGSGWPSWAFSNHDVPRAVSRWAAPEERDAVARLAMLLLVSLRGNIFIYQGEELGLMQATVGFPDLRDPEAIANWPLTLGRDGARTPHPWQSAAANVGFSTAQPWLPFGAEHAALAVDRQCQDPNSQLALTRRLIAFRQRQPALRVGSLRFIDSGQDVLAFERRAASQTLLCAFNLGRTTRPWQPVAGKRWQLLEQVGAATVSTLPPLSGLIAAQLP